MKLNYIEGGKNKLFKIEAKLEKQNLKLFWRCDSKKALLILNVT